MAARQATHGVVVPFVQSGWEGVFKPTLRYDYIFEAGPTRPLPN